jgi:hypothetical protein
VVVVDSLELLGRRHKDSREVLCWQVVVALIASAAALRAVHSYSSVTPVVAVYKLVQLDCTLPSLAKFAALMTVHSPVVEEGGDSTLARLTVLRTCRCLQLPLRTTPPVV